VKVLDFRHLEHVWPRKGQTCSILTNGGDLRISLYMSPEPMLSTKTADARTDVWALGVILYKLTSGAVPFRGSNIIEICARVAARPARWCRMYQE
jgi:serine/threonine-protein kinase